MSMDGGIYNTTPSFQLADAKSFKEASKKFDFTEKDKKIVS